MKNARQLVLLALSTLVASACGGSSSGVGPSGSDGVEFGMAQVSLGSNGHPELVSLRTTLTSIGLVHPLGTTTPLIETPISVEWVGLTENQMWLGTHELESSEYVGFLLTFDTQATSGELASGQVVNFETDESAFVPFDEDFHITPEAMSSGYIELDLLASIQLTEAPRFQPVGGAANQLPSVPTEALYGVVRDVAAGGVILVQAYADADLRRVLGPLEVVLADSVLLIDDGGEVFASREAFYGSLRPGFSLLELEGDLQAGSRFRACRIEIIDQALGNGRTLPVRIAGKVTALHDHGFEMSVRRVLSGEETARPVLEGLDTPHRIDVAIDAMTRILAGPDGTDAVRPAVGHAVITEFREFVMQPFPADVVLLQRTTQCYRGVIGDTSAADGFVLLTRSDHADDEAARLAVRLGDAPITLLLRNRPRLNTRDLITGMAAEACGTPDDTTDQNDLNARSVQVHPGVFARADVATFDRASASFRTTTSFVLHSFGTQIHSGPLAVQLRPHARLHGVVDSIDAFFDLLETLPDDVQLVVNGKGIGSEQPATVQLFDLEVHRVVRDL